MRIATRQYFRCAYCGDYRFRKQTAVFNSDVTRRLSKSKPTVFLKREVIFESSQYVSIKFRKEKVLAIKKNNLDLKTTLKTGHVQGNGKSEHPYPEDMSSGIH
jgi:hypothetical protein